MLHHKHNSRSPQFEDLYASSGVLSNLPKRKFPKGERDPREIYNLIHDELLLDPSNRLNLANWLR